MIGLGEYMPDTRGLPVSQVNVLHIFSPSYWGSYYYTGFFKDNIQRQEAITLQMCSLSYFQEEILGQVQWRPSLPPILSNPSLKYRTKIVHE